MLINLTILKKYLKINCKKSVFDDFYEKTNKFLIFFAEIKEIKSRDATLYKKQISLIR